MTLSDMAREIERRRPGTLPHALQLSKHEVRYVWARTLESDGTVSASTVQLTDGLAAAILRDAMVMATRAARIAGGWTVPVVPPEDQPWEDRCTFADADHGNCPTRSLFAAFCAAFPEDKS